MILESARVQIDERPYKGHSSICTPCHANQSSMSDFNIIANDRPLAQPTRLNQPGNSNGHRSDPIQTGRREDAPELVQQLWYGEEKLINTAT